MEHDDIKELLRETLLVAQANNKLLHGMRRSARWSAFLKGIYWLIVLGGLGISYYYVQPYLQTILSAYDSIQSNMQEIKKTQNSLPDFRKFIENVKAP